MCNSSHVRTALFRAPLLAIFTSSLLLWSLSVPASCRRLRETPRPSGVPAGAQLDRKTGLWTHQTQTAFQQYFAEGGLSAEGALRQGRREGPWRAWSMDGRTVITTGRYLAGRRDGTWRHFDDEGRLYLLIHYARAPVRDFGFFSHPDYGNENGPYERYFPDGSLEERGTFRGGYYEGEMVRYHRNGRVAVRGTFRKDLMEGTWSYYYPEGSLERTETYVEGRLGGLLSNYHPDGSVYQKALYERGGRKALLELHPRSAKP